MVDAKSNPAVTPLGERNLALDGVRGVAILLVLVFHSVKIQPNHAIDAAFHQLTMALWCGVDLFFVLSGFLITGILLDTRDRPRFFQNFYMRRTLRIFPLYYGVLVVVMILAPATLWLIYGRVPFQAVFGPLLENQVYAWTYTSNFIQAWESQQLPGMGHFWSLAIEEQFYLLWPLCVFLMPSKQLLRFSIGLVIAVFALRLGIHAMGVWSRSVDGGFANPMLAWLAQFDDGGAMRQLTFFRIDTLVVGGIGAMIVRRSDLLEKLLPYLLPIMVCAIVGLAATWVASGLFDAERAPVYTFGYSLLAILFTCWILRVVSIQPGPTVRLLENPALGVLGQYSYGLYVFHWPITHAMRALKARGMATAPYLGTDIVDGLIQLVLISALTLATAWLSWHLWEVHWLKLKKYFDYRRPEPKPQLPESATAGFPEMEPALAEVGQARL